jgi:hypothetical protein
MVYVRVYLCLLHLGRSADLHGAHNLMPVMVGQYLSVTVEALYFGVMSAWVLFVFCRVYGQLRSDTPALVRTALLAMPVLFWVVSMCILSVGWAWDRDAAYGVFALWLCAVILFYLSLMLWVYRSLAAQLRAFIAATQTPGAGFVVDMTHIHRALRRLAAFMCVLMPLGLLFELLMGAVAVVALSPARLDRPMQPPPERLSEVWHAVLLDVVGWALLAGICW